HCSNSRRLRELVDTSSSSAARVNYSPHDHVSESPWATLKPMALSAKRWQDSASETSQVVLPHESNPLGYILGGTVMHMIDITGALACHRHTNSLALTAGVDSLDFIHPIKVGDIIILKSRVNATFKTSLEVEVEVFSEGITSGERKLTSK